MTRYEPLQLSFVRIQIFEAKSVSSLLASSTIDRYNAAPPIYLAFPDSSPFIIHAYLPSTNIYFKAVFQALSLTFSKVGGQSLEIRPSKEVPIKSLEAFAILKGANRAAQSQAAWGIYARGEADSQSNPLEPYSLCTKRQSEQELEHHVRQKRAQKRRLSDESLLKMINLRFHGNIEHSGDKEDNMVEGNVQMSTAEFAIESEYQGNIRSGSGSGTNTFTPKLALRLQGTDVFGGIKDLALARVVDICNMPGWLTGENGSSSGTVINGRFHQD